VTVTVQLEEQHPAEDLYVRHRLLNQKGAFRRQRLANKTYRNSKATTMTTPTATSAV
jgi:hypothetical protein